MNKSRSALKTNNQFLKFKQSKKKKKKQKKKTKIQKTKIQNKTNQK